MSARKTRTNSPIGPAAPEDLDAAVASLLEVMRRAVAKSEQDPPFQELVDFMDKYSRVCTRLAALMKAQRGLAEEQGLTSALNQALNDLMDEMKAR